MWRNGELTSRSRGLSAILLSGLTFASLPSLASGIAGCPFHRGNYIDCAICHIGEPTDIVDTHLLAPACPACWVNRSLVENVVGIPEGQPPQSAPNGIAQMATRCRHAGPYGNARGRRRIQPEPWMTASCRGLRRRVEPGSSVSMPVLVLARKSFRRNILAVVHKSTPVIARQIWTMDHAAEPASMLASPHASF